MENINLRYICKGLANLSGIPTRVFDGEKLLYIYSVVKLPRDPMEVYRSEIWQVTDHLGYYITPRFHLYGIINSGRIKIVVGPTAQIIASDQSLRELAFQADVPKEEVRDFITGMKSITRMSLESLIMTLCPINYIVNGEELELKDVAISEADQRALKENVERRRTKKTYEEDIPTTPHNTLQLEESLMVIVGKGDTAALEQWIGHAPAVRGGVLAKDQLRQLKNTFIVTTALTSRAAIRGGMDVDDAFTLSDAYIQWVERCGSQNEIVNLQLNMVREFTEQVQKLRRGAAPSKLQIDVANYIQHHLSEPIRTEQIAREFYMSRTHFSSKFKAETGMTLTDFIMKEKTEEAKRLLRFSDKSAATIGAYLGFSSHAHFINVFKRYTGMTPNEYRTKCANRH